MTGWAHDLRQSDRSRVAGVDVARALALLGMMAVHMTPPEHVLHDVAAGRASALFAVLAGLSLALVTGGASRHRGRLLAADAAGIGCRALVIAGIGLWLGGLETGIAVILTYYGVLFLLGLPFLALPLRWLVGLAVSWCVVSPFVSHLVRSRISAPGPLVPTGSDLFRPGELVANLTLTGYYPAIPWLTYLLAGLALGRLDLRSMRSAAAVTLTGTGVALSAAVVSGLLLGTGPARSAITASPTTAGTSWATVWSSVASGSFYGTTPTDSAWWLAVAQPHSGTPLDLAHTAGTACMVVGLALLASRWRPRLWAVLLGAGAMTLSLYTAHLVMLTPEIWPHEGPEHLMTQVLVVLAVGASFALLRARGPLELLVRRISGAVAERALQVMDRSPAAT